MAYDGAIRRYRRWYDALLHLYPRPYYERFGEGMEQTFGDLLRERAEEKKGVFAGVLWMFVETSVGIIKENLIFTFMQKITTRLIVWAVVVLALLIIPVIGMQASNEWNWSLFDFVFAFVVLFGAGVIYELLSKRANNKAYKFAVALAVGAALLLVWINGAVGVIGDDEWPNAMYLGVLIIGLFGAILSRFSAKGMSRTMFAMAIAQMLVPTIVFFVDRSLLEQAPGIAKVFALNAFFALLFAFSGLLFRQASDPASR